jgi:hypothetical protein
MHVETMMDAVALLALLIQLAQPPTMISEISSTSPKYPESESAPTKAIIL